MNKNVDVESNTNKPVEKHVKILKRNETNIIDKTLGLSDDIVTAVKNEVLRVDDGIEEPELRILERERKIDPEEDSIPILGINVTDENYYPMVDSGCSHVLINAKVLDKIRKDRPETIKGEIKCRGGDSHFTQAAGKVKAKATSYAEIAFKFATCTETTEYV